MTTMNKKPTKCTIVLKIIKTLLYSYYALHVSGPHAPIIRSLLILQIQPPVTVCRWVGCIFQLWSVTSGTLAPIIRTLPILHIQPPVTLCRWVGCFFQLWSVTSGTLAPIIRSLLILHIQPPVTYQFKTRCLLSNPVKVCYCLQFVYLSY
jgi:hypothetical protein